MDLSLHWYGKSSYSGTGCVLPVYSCGAKPCRERDPLRHITAERSRENERWNLSQPITLLHGCSLLAAMRVVSRLYRSTITVHLVKVCIHSFLHHVSLLKLVQMSLSAVKVFSTSFAPPWKSRAGLFQYREGL